MQKENYKVLDTKYIDNKDGQRYESLGKKLVERNAEIHEDIEGTKEKDLMKKITMCNTVEEEKVVIFDNTIVRQIILSENNDAAPPAPPTTCCMSGCHNCVWIEYADSLARHYRDGGVEACRKIEKEIEDPSLRAYILMEVRLKGLGK
ncbi:hypothetical protein Pcinc_027735 [Petrolisthes cinctipes]|uniref:Oxidoreductase-like domain-containing protein n=1 Tax=Petrolisthes cinctipes TaxID=88211 RepID=A0AAE1K6B1_PETCI|nr:hypothetical protein Pcinc_027735 [Petrolisthes cinctipes]